MSVESVLVAAELRHGLARLIGEGVELFVDIDALGEEPTMGGRYRITIEPIVA